MAFTFGAAATLFCSHLLGEELGLIVELRGHLATQFGVSGFDGSDVLLVRLRLIIVEWLEVDDSEVLLPRELQKVDA